MKFSDKYSEFLKYAKQNGLFGADSGIIVALSGGADSMVLLHFLHRAYSDNKISYLHAFHLNHCLRSEADSEEEFVRDYCHSHNIPFTSVKEDVSSYARKNRISEETAGRILRYEHLRKLKEKTGCGLIATAHHADDNAETILMRLIRGTALRGMGGIRPVNGDVIRPVLFLTKEEILHIADAENIPYVTDMSNFEDMYLRNRIRNNIMPLITKENPSFARSLLRTGEVMRDAWDYVLENAQEIPVFEEDGKVYCRYGDISGKNDFLVCAVIMKMTDALTGADNVGYEQIKKLSMLLKESPAQRWEYHLPGILVTFGDGILLAQRNEEKKTPVSYRYTIESGGNYDFEDIRVKICTKILKKDENFVINSYIKAVDYDKIKGSLYISPKVPAQKFRPVGRNMTKSVSKYLSDSKVPMDIRERMPVFSDDEGVVCVGNMEIDERVKITPQTENILQIETIIY